MQPLGRHRSAVLRSEMHDHTTTKQYTSFVFAKMDRVPLLLHLLMAASMRRVHEMNAPTESAWNHRRIVREQIPGLANSSLLCTRSARSQSCNLAYSNALQHSRWCSRLRSKAQIVQLGGQPSTTVVFPGTCLIVSWHSPAAANPSRQHPVGSLAPEDSECSRVSCQVEQPKPTKGDLRSLQNPAIRFFTRQRFGSTPRARGSTH
jgi:hypothetical protein